MIQRDDSETPTGFGLILRAFTTNRQSRRDGETDNNTLLRRLRTDIY
ncbi:MAG: hypothetical protein ACRC10_10875 [Thermoguttaceae bacterium]